MTQQQIKTKLDEAADKSVTDMGEVYREARSGLVRYVSRFFRRTQEAEDVVQEAFVKVIEAQREREIQAPKAYLYQTARNTALAEIKKKSFRLTDTLDETLLDSDILMTKSMEEQFSVNENFEVFCSAVRTLPVKCRRAYVLCRVYGFSQKEVAVHMGISLKGVEGHLARATRRCLEYIETRSNQKDVNLTARREGRTNEQR